MLYIRYMYRFLLFILLLPVWLMAQPYQLSGTIVNGENDQPVEGASIFINGASGGTVSGKGGEFVLVNITFSKFELVISHVSFETLVVPITTENIAKKFKIQLTPKQEELQNVVIAPVEKNGWERWGRLFVNNFIGTSELANNCVIKNPSVLRFRYNKNTGVLKVSGSDKLIIENKRLGYTIGYQLEDFVFDQKHSMTSYVGYTSFTPMQSSRNRKIENWKKERLEAYNGSLSHFMRTLYNNTTATEGFELRTLRRIYKHDTATRALYDALMHGTPGLYDTSRYVMQLYKPANSFQPPIIYLIGKHPISADSICKRNGDTVKLFFSDNLMVLYKNEKEKPEYVTQRSGMNMKPQAQHSLIYFVVDEPVIVEKSGLFFNPLNIFTEDYWAWEKTAEMLPADYQLGD